MKKLLIPLMISLTMLCGCASSAQESFISFAREVSEASYIHFTAEVQTELNGSTSDFTLAYTQNDGDAEIEVIKPEMIAGIKARLKDGSARLEYDGAILDLGESGGGISPMSALPILASAIRGSHVELSWTENDLLAARLIPSDDMAVTLWLDGELIPQNAEISCDGRTVVYITIHDWEMS